MKSGKTLVELAQEIERQRAASSDVLVDTPSITLEAAKGQPITLNLPAEAGGKVGVTEHTHNQIGDRLGIPGKFYDRLRVEQPDMLAYNVNELFRRSPERRMLRLLDGNARAFLSDRYQRIDNHHVANVVLPLLLNVPGIKVVSCEITERRLYIKAVNPNVKSEVQSRRVGDVVEAGVIISNSEIGAGSLYVDPFLHFLACLNGMVIPKAGLKKYHVGRRHDVVDAEFTVLSDETKRLEDAATLSKVGDVLRGAMDQGAFEQNIARMQVATTQRIEGSPVKAIEVLGQSLGITQGERVDVLKHLIEGGDLSRYGLMNAVTRSAADIVSYDRATEVEAIGGALLNLSAANWNQIAQAA